MASWWQRFLNSLSTPGGNLFILVVFVGVFFGFLLHALSTPNANDKALTVISTTFTGFSSALLLGLRARASDAAAQSATGTLKANGTD